MSDRVKRGTGLRRLVPISVVFVGPMLSMFPGCAADKKPPTTQPMSMHERQDAALRDPMNYKPDMSRDVSGGDIGNLDRDGLKKDLNNVLSP
ncbi:MAG: hypothetical protein WBD40_11310 [Tepidisphaeraceae bacterium]